MTISYLPKKKTREYFYVSVEGANNRIQYAQVVQKIYSRLRSEGYTYKDGIFYDPEGNEAKSIYKYLLTSYDEELPARDTYFESYN